MRTNVQPLLEPGEQIQSVVRAQTGPSPWLGVLTYLFFFFIKYVLIVATDRRIAVVRSGMWSQAGAKEILETHARETRLGPVTGSVWARLQLGGTRYWVHRRFFKDVEAADAGRTS
jgi:hypothetical protein